MLVKIIRMKANAAADTVIIYMNPNAVVETPICIRMRSILMNPNAAVAVAMTIRIVKRNIPMRVNAAVAMTITPMAIMTMLITPIPMNPPNPTTLPPCQPVSLREFTSSITWAAPTVPQRWSGRSGNSRGSRWQPSHLQRSS